MIGRLKASWEGRFHHLRPRIFLLGLVARALPERTAGRVRASLMRAMGFAVGPGTSVLGMPRLTGADAPLQDNLRIGAECTIGPGCLIEVGEKLTLGDRVRLGTEVLIITTTHELGPKEHRAGPLTRRPVTIGEGAIIGARAILLPGVNVGAGAQVLAGSVVNKDVAPGTRAGGIPAKPLGPVEPAAA